MKEIKEKLNNDYSKATDLITVSDPNTEGYKLLLEERDKVRNEMIKLELGKMENAVKHKQIEAENKREKVRNWITIGTFSVTTGVGAYFALVTFLFDKENTVTSTLGRNFLNNIVPKGLRK